MSLPKFNFNGFQPQNINTESLTVQLLLFIDKSSSDPNARLGAVFLLIFITVLLLTYVRRHYFRISLKGAKSGFIFGVLATIAIELALFLFISAKITAMIADHPNARKLLKLKEKGDEEINRILGSSKKSVSTPSAAPREE